MSTNGFETSASGTTIGYKVQARSIGSPHVLDGLVVTKDWATLPFPKAWGGVRNNLFCPLADHAGIFSYSTAVALMAWQDADMGGFLSGLEFRLVKVELCYKWKTRAIGFSEPRSFCEDERGSIWLNASPEVENPR